jgi:hypothetical protein
MLTAGFEPAIPTSDRPQNHALDSLSSSGRFKPFPILRRSSSDSMIFLFRSDVGRRPTRFLLHLFARCRSLSDVFPHVVRTLANRLYSFCSSMLFSFKTVG